MRGLRRLIERVQRLHRIFEPSRRREAPRPIELEPESIDRPRGRPLCLVQSLLPAIPIVAQEPRLRHALQCEVELGGHLEGFQEAGFGVDQAARGHLRLGQ